MDATIQELQRCRVQYEIKRLSVGDFLWICREKLSGNEFVLPYIVERKRMDDLAGSIKDKRYHEQKFRLKESGITNIIYLIEKMANCRSLGLPIENLMQATCNTQIQSGFHVKFTNSHKHSMSYLVQLTNMLKEMFLSKELIVKNSPTNHLGDTAVPVLEFNSFNKKSLKMRHFSIRDLFVRQLLQLRTLSLDKSLSIVQQYPTPKTLLHAYSNCKDQREAENLLAKIEYGQIRKCIGPIISKCIYHFYNAQQPS